MVQKGIFKIAEQQKIIESAIQALQWPVHPEDLYAPARYMMGLGGKRLRPLLTMLACHMCGGSVEVSLKPALAMEVFHNFTLVHDDLMDNASLRRGKKTVHEKWNPTTAILSGDVMLILAYDLLLESPKEKLPLVIRLFNDTAKKVCEGQQLDMEYESRESVSEEAYLEMIGLKTAALLAGCLKMGALLSDAPATVAEKLYNCGYLLGTAFQIQDDLLDSFGDTADFGKRIGGDILAGKKTYLTVKAFELANNETAQQLRHLLENNSSFDDEKRVEQVLAIYRKLDVQKVAETARNRFFTEGLSLLNDLQVNETSKETFTQLAESLVYRKS